MPKSADRHSIFAVTAPGLERVAADELAELGIRAAAEPGGVAWDGSLEQVYTANLRLRTASRVLVRVAEFRARTFFELERHARRIEWERWLSPGRQVQLRVTCRKSRLYHEGAVAQRLVAAIDHRAGAVPAAAAADEEAEGAAAQLFVVRFLHDRCTVSADTSGALLHLRGYRQALAKAPLRETLAAAILRASGWHGQAPLLDPMCGSGTIPIEAALVARHIAPGLAGAGGEGPRQFAFQSWPAHDPARWTAAVDRAREEILPAAPVPIHGSDRDAGAIQAAHSNAERAGVASDLTLTVAPLSAVEPPAGTGWVISNPPYGVRVGESAPLRNLYATLGRFGGRRMPGWTLALLSANRQLEIQTGVRCTETLRTTNGGIPVRLIVGTFPG
jgi:putative N6-adenine-specific DNA methylase